MTRAQTTTPIQKGMPKAERMLPQASSWATKMPSREGTLLSHAQPRISLWEPKRASK